MQSIYELMEKDWETYCLMSGIALIEEMSKPTKHIQTKIYKNNKSDYITFHTIRLKVTSLDIINKWFNITKKWEKNLNLRLIGTSFKKPKVEKYSGQYYFNFSPIWLFNILKTTGKIPSKYTYDICLDRLKALHNWNSGSIYFLSKKNILSITKSHAYKNLFLDKNLAAGAFIISFDLEFKGVQTGKPELCMTTKYEDFLQFMFKIAKIWGWNTSDKLADTCINHSLKRGINATPKKQFGLKIEALKEIYTLAGPLADKNKDKYIKININRINRENKYKPFRQKGETKRIILETLKNNLANNSTELQQYANVRTDVILDHLHSLETEGKVIKERKGKGYFWRFNNAN